MIKKIGAAKFKETCLSLLDNLDPEGLVVTKHGKPVARVIPYIDSPAERIGALKHHIRIHDDILSTEVDWDASAEP